MVCGRWNVHRVDATESVRTGFGYTGIPCILLSYCRRMKSIDGPRCKNIRVETFITWKIRCLVGTKIPVRSPVSLSQLWPPFQNAISLDHLIKPPEARSAAILR